MRCETRTRPGWSQRWMKKEFIGWTSMVRIKKKVEDDWIKKKTEARNQSLWEGTEPQDLNKKSSDTILNLTQWSIVQP
jgi:hypothetical protein